ncbi:MAG TPA: VOC family protein [Polyangiaceae bacterium]|nr:VOC family protein [Polyangiaceae bacterium]
MQHAINWFELPTTDLDRAARFYEQVLGVSFKREHFAGTDMHMAVFQGEQESVRGALIADERRKPVADGTLVYLHAPKLDESLSRIERAGGSVVMPKTDIGDPGFIALVRDTEGNVVGLHTPR